MKYEQKGSNIYEMTVRHADTGFARYSKWFSTNYSPGVNPVFPILAVKFACL